MKKKHRIEVRFRNSSETKIIHRVLRQEAIGNFCPIFCTYLGEMYLVKSEAGDLSDPFRREENYLNNLYITV